MFTFVTLSRGWDLKTARPIGVSLDLGLAAAVARRLAEEEAERAPDDPALAALTRGRLAALRQCQREAIVVGMPDGPQAA